MDRAICTPQGTILPVAYAGAELPAARFILEHVRTHEHAELLCDFMFLADNLKPAYYTKHDPTPIYNKHDYEILERVEKLIAKYSLGDLLEYQSVTHGYTTNGEDFYTMTSV